MCFETAAIFTSPPPASLSPCSKDGSRWPTRYQILPRQLVNGGRLSGNGVEKLENATRRSIKHIASFLRGSWKAVHEEEDEEDERERRRFEDIDR